MRLCALCVRSLAQNIWGTPSPNLFVDFLQMLPLEYIAEGVWMVLKRFAHVDRCTHIHTPPPGIFPDQRSLPWAFFHNRLVSYRILMWFSLFRFSLCIKYFVFLVKYTSMWRINSYNGPIMCLDKLVCYNYLKRQYKHTFKAKCFIKRNLLGLNSG